MNDDRMQKSGCGASCGCTDSAAPTHGDIDRRSFLVRGAMAAAAVALASCGVGGYSDATAPSSVSTTVKVSDYPALATVGGVALISASGSPIAVVRTGSASFVAVSRICPHQGATVNPDGSGFTCPRHGARFNGTGTWIGGQPTSSLRSYPTAYDDSSGTITIG